MPDTDTAPVDYDPGAPHVLDDPFPTYAALRAQCPVHRFDGLGRTMYTLSRYRDVRDVLTHPDTWSNRYGPGIGMDGRQVGDLQRYDEPEHAQRRRFLRDRFLPRSVAAMEPAIEALGSRLLDDLEPRGNCELHADYAMPIALEGFIDMLGLAADGAGDFKRWADELTVGMTYPDRARDARRAMTDYTVGEVARRRAAVRAADLPPGADPVGTVVADGLLSHLACHALDDGTVMGDAEVANMLSQLLVAGHETTTSLICNATWRLLEDPARWHHVRDNLDLLPQVVEESLRYDPPVLGLCKTNDQPVERYGVEIEVDTKVQILYASANRDPDLFDAPDEFRVDRPLIESKKHLSFGWGIHFCLGAHLARLSARTALRLLMQRLPDVELAGPATRIEAPFLWGRATLPLRWLT